MRLLPLLLAVLAITGCTRADNRWTPGTKGQGITVVVAPVAAPVLAAEWKEGPIDLAYTAAGRIDLFGKGLDGLVGETLPDGASEAWKGPLADAASADVIVLMRLDAPRRLPGASGPQIVVEGTLQVIDPYGREEFARPVRGVADDVATPKLIGPAHTPLATACTAAAADAAGQAVDYLKARGTKAPQPQTVEVTIASTPPNADVLVDGQLKGTTPCVLKLPPKAVALRLERQGCRPWERTITATEPLSLTPALEPAGP